MTGNLSPTRMKRTLSIVSAIVLSAITLAVFALLQDHGPESALRRFHFAAVNQNQRVLMEVTQPNVEPEVLLQLQQSVYSVARMGGRYEVRQIMRGNGKAQALVIYSIPRRNQEIAIMWALQRERGRWRVDPRSTHEMMFAFQAADQ